MVLVNYFRCLVLHCANSSTDIKPSSLGPIGKRSGFPRLDIGVTLSRYAELLVTSLHFSPSSFWPKFSNKLFYTPKLAILSVTIFLIHKRRKENEESKRISEYRALPARRTLSPAMVNQSDLGFQKNRNIRSPGVDGRIRETCHFLLNHTTESEQ